MSHIDEGLLHAHLDGAVEAGDLDWQAALVHLEECGDCARRLAEARRLRDGASALLAEADASPAGRPSFAELEALAAAGADGVGVAAGSALRRPPVRRKRGRFSAGRLAWAASLVMAAGAGWISRELAIEEGVFSGRATLQSEEAASAARDQAVPSRAPDETAALSATERDRNEGELFPRIAVPAEEDADEAPVERRLIREVPGELLKSEDGAEVDRVAANGADPEAVQDRALQAGNEGALADAQVPAAAPRRNDAGADDHGTPDARRNAETAAFRQRNVAVDTAVRCYVSEGDARARDAAAADFEDPTPAAGDLESLELSPDGTAHARHAGGAIVGFWSEAAGDSVEVRLTGGGPWLGLRLARTGTGLFGPGGHWIDTSCSAIR